MVICHVVGCVIVWKAWSFGLCTGNHCLCCCRTRWRACSTCWCSCWPPMTSTWWRALRASCPTWRVTTSATRWWCARWAALRPWYAPSCRPATARTSLNLLWVCVLCVGVFICFFVGWHGFWHTYFWSPAHTLFCCYLFCASLKVFSQMVLFWHVLGTRTLSVCSWLWQKPLC